MSTTLRRYDLPSIRGEGYAFIVIDTKDGYFSTVSDWGNYAYQWTHPGGEFRAFLAQLDPGYLHSKLMSGRADMRVFDGEATKAAVVKELAEFAELDPEQAAEEILLLEDHDVETEEGFSEWLRETKLGDAHDLAQTEPEPQCWAFCTKVWPRFAEVLRAELAAEAAAA